MSLSNTPVRYGLGNSSRLPILPLSPVSTVIASQLTNSPLTSVQLRSVAIASNKFLKTISPSLLITASINGKFLKMSLSVIGISGPPNTMIESGNSCLIRRASA